jgi:hypothetical protein
MDHDDLTYPFTWLPSDDHANEASELAEGGRRLSRTELGRGPLLRA